MARNAFDSVLMRQMNLESIIQKEVSQKKILYINVYIWNLERWYWWTYLQGSSGDADIENRLLDTVWEREGGMIWESSIETLYTTICKVDSQWEFVVWYREPKAGALGQPRGVGWGRKWEGSLGGRRHMYTYGWFMLTYGRSHHNIVK